MASEKKPSIYYDRGTIGSSDELDEYGVWVKGEPQDLSSVGMESQESADLSDPDLPDMDDLLDFNASANAEALSGESSDDNISLDEDLELPDIDFEDEGEEASTEFEEPPAGVDESGDADESAGTGDTESFELNEFPEPDFSDFTESGAGEGEGSGEMLSGGEAENLGFVEVPMDVEDDAAAEDVQVPDDFGKGEKSPQETKSSPQDLSTRLLMRIADELASIRTELSTLKSELAGIKTEGVPAETDDAQNHGFFGDEDDEKIALTGDELDNILNTADFTEEAGADATEKPGEDFNIQEAADNSSESFQEITETPSMETLSEETETGDVSLDDITKDLDLDVSLEERDLDELGGEINFDQTDQAADADEVPAGQDTLLEEPIEFDITMNDGGEELPAESPVDEAPPPEEAQTEDTQDTPEGLSGFEDKDSEDLRQLRESGAQPMTPAPEDTSYLEEDPLAFPEFDEESLDLSNAVIDEPDLSGEIQENPLQEPSLDDISIDLDLDEEISLEEDEEIKLDGTEETENIEEEIELPVLDESQGIEEEDLGDFSAGSADLAVIPEGFVVEAEDPQIPSIDEGEEVFSETEEPDEPDIVDADIGLENVQEEALPQVLEDSEAIPSHLKQELKTVLSYMDQLLESLPDEKIEEFAKSEYFDTYKKLFKELGLV
jgi:hypothetical protein